MNEYYRLESARCNQAAVNWNHQFQQAFINNQHEKVNNHRNKGEVYLPRGQIGANRKQLYQNNNVKVLTNQSSKVVIDNQPTNNINDAYVERLRQQMNIHHNSPNPNFPPNQTLKPQNESKGKLN